MNPPTLSLIVPAYNEEKVIDTTLNILREIIDNLKKQNFISNLSYILVVDDGSSDSTWKIVETCHQNFPSEIFGIKLTRNFGHQPALLAGILQAKINSEISISIDADLQQDPHSIPLFIKAYINGADVVFGVRNDRSNDSLFKKLSAEFFYWLMGKMGVPILPNHADYRLLSNKAMTALTQYPEHNLLLRALCLQLGFKTAKVTFDVSERKLGNTKYTLSKMIGLAITGITSFSERPLRLISVFGILIFGASLIMGIYILFQTLIMGNVIPGWASTTLPIYALGGIQLLSLAIIGEYIAQIYITTKSRPRFLIEKTLL